MKINRFKKVIALLGILVIALVVFFYIQNNWIEITDIDITSPKILNDIKIVHLSDLHGKEFGKDNSALIRRVKEQQPDIIAFTGDLISRSDKNIVGSVKLLNELGKISPVYYIPGNHERCSGKSEILFGMLREAGVKVLACDKESLKIKDTEIAILGLDEPSNKKRTIDVKLKEFEKIKSYKILLSHYPENFSKKYNKYDIDMVLSGHAHGGQFILPFVGGIYAPGQGFLPKYYKGLYSENGSNLIVSRGLGNSSMPVRLFNRPEIVSINLKPDKYE